MSEQKVALSFSYTSVGQADTEENRWIKVEQIQPEDETISVGEAAEVIDEIFGTDACDQGMEGGGEASETDTEGVTEGRPDEKKVAEILKKKMLGEDLCNQKKYWIAEVNVLKSHQQPGHVLQSESAEVLGVELISADIKETLEPSGTSVDLTWPYAGGLSTNAPDGITATVMGSTLNLSAALALEKITVSYKTTYERVKLKVPVEAEAEQNEDDSHSRPELPPAALIAFWSDLAAACELEPPEQDDSTQDELDLLCAGSGGATSGNEPECFETISHYQKCNCSKGEVNIWEEIVPALCPEEAAGKSHYNVYRTQFDGYVECAEDDSVSKAWYYKSQCCEDVPEGKALPRCRTTYAEYKWGAAIEGGAAFWRDIYGEKTRMISTLPEDGVCGEIITEWKITAKNCCAGVPELNIDPDTAPEVVADNSEVFISFLGGLGPYTVSTASDGLYVGEVGGKEVVILGQVVLVRSTSICGMVAINIKDSCGQSATHRMRATNGRWVGCTGEVPKCAGGAPDPVNIGAYYESISGEYKLLFDRVGSIFSSIGCSPDVSNPVENCEAHCRTDMIANGGEPDSCGVWNTFIWIYIEGNCPAGTAQACGCQGVKPVENLRWVC